jgi:hypothetical protein
LSFLQPPNAERLYNTSPGEYQIIAEIVYVWSDQLRKGMFFVFPLLELQEWMCFSILHCILDAVVRKHIILHKNILELVSRLG